MAFLLPLAPPSSVPEAFERCHRVDSDLALVSQPIQIAVLATEQSVPHREHVCAGNRERLALGCARHHVLGDEILGAGMSSLWLKTQVGGGGDQRLDQFADF